MGVQSRIISVFLVATIFLRDGECIRWRDSAAKKASAIHEKLRQVNQEIQRLELLATKLYLPGNSRGDKSDAPPKFSNVLKTTPFSRGSEASQTGKEDAEEERHKEAIASIETQVMQEAKETAKEAAIPNKEVEILEAPEVLGFRACGTKEHKEPESPCAAEGNDYQGIAHKEASTETKEWSSEPPSQHDRQEDEIERLTPVKEHDSSTAQKQTREAEKLKLKAREQQNTAIVAQKKNLEQAQAMDATKHFGRQEPEKRMEKVEDAWKLLNKETAEARAAESAIDAARENEEPVEEELNEESNHDRVQAENDLEESQIIGDH